MPKKAVFLSFIVGIVVVLLAACGGASDSNTSGDDAGVAPPADVQGAGENNANASGGDSDGTSGGTTVSNSLVDRKIERQATLEITAENIPATVAKIEAAAGAVGGFISQATITQAIATEDDDTPRQQATVQIRVPSQHYSAVMTELRGLAKDVTSENATTQEVTGEYTDLQSQLRNLQATEAQYLTLLARATTIEEILTVQDRLNGIQGQIETVQGRINLIDNLSALATITINVSPPPLVPFKADAKDQNWAQESWANSWEASRDIARVLGVVAITTGVLGVWLLVPGAIGLAGWRLWERGKKREAPTG
jgi:hypothetical protein